MKFLDAALCSTIWPSTWPAISAIISLRRAILRTAGWFGLDLSHPLFLTSTIALALICIVWLWWLWLRRIAPPYLARKVSKTLPLLMIKLATVDLRLDDPEDRQAFEQFLDQPIFSAGEAHVSAAVKTPSQLFEDAILSYVHEIEEEYGGTLSVQVNLHRGSFAIGLTFFAAYEFLAQYHDFTESIGTIRRQIRELVQDASKWYRQQTGRDICVHSTVSIEPPVTDVHSKERATGGTAEETIGEADFGTQSQMRNQPSSVEVHSNEGAASNVNDVQINVHARSQGEGIGYTLCGLILVGVAILAAVVYCTSTAENEICTRPIITIGEWFRNWTR